MKIFWVPIAAFFLLLGCGGGGGSQSPIPTPVIPPAISNLQYSPQSESIFSLGGQQPITVSWSFQYSSNSSNIETWTLAITDTQGNTSTSTAAFPFSGANGTASGTIVPDNSTAGTIKFSIYVVDKNGNKSNTITGDFIVTPGPQISTLWGPGSAAGWCGITVAPIFTGGTGVIQAFDTNGGLISSSPLSSGETKGYVFSVMVNGVYVTFRTLTITITAPSGDHVSYTQSFAPSGAPRLCGS